MKVHNDVPIQKRNHVHWHANVHWNVKQNRHTRNSQMIIKPVTFSHKTVSIKPTTSSQLFSFQAPPKFSAIWPHPRALHLISGAQLKRWLSQVGSVVFFYTRRCFVEELNFQDEKWFLSFLFSFLTMYLLNIKSHSKSKLLWTINTEKHLKWVRYKKPS